MQKAQLFAALSMCLVPKGVKNAKNVVPDATSHPFSLATTPCENELFAADGQFMEREGSHNVKKCTNYFTY